MTDEAGSFEKLMQLSRQLERARGMRARLESMYLSGMLRLTRILERTGHPSSQSLPDGDILNFGCGLHFIDGVNSDLFMMHRYITRKRRPDIYLSGSMTPKSLQERFSSIVCEHVLDIVLPNIAYEILVNLRNMLRPGGKIQVSLPSPSRFIKCTEEGPRLDMIPINDTAYNYGHRFMYDEATLALLLRAAGYTGVQINSYRTSPLQDYMNALREPRSIYVMASKKAE